MADEPILAECPCCGSTLRIDLGVVRMSAPSRSEQLELEDGKLRAAPAVRAPSIAERESAIVLSSMEEAAERHGVSVADVVSRSRVPAVIEARFEAMWLATERGIGPSAIGRVMERDHSTVLSGVRTYRDRLAA